METLESTLEKTLSEIPDNKSVFAVMDKTGDTKYLWDPNNPTEVEMARNMFRDYRAKGFLVFKATGKEGVKGEQVNEFDPTQGRYIFVPPMVGG